MAPAPLPVGGHGPALVDPCAGGRAELFTRWANRSRGSKAVLGRCRGTVLGRWAELCRRHFGEAGLARVRQAAGPMAWGLPERPHEDQWFPVELQVALTEAVIEECLAGDPCGLEPLLIDEGRRNIGRATALFLGAVGPGPVLTRVDKIHGQLYDAGRAHATLTGPRAVLEYSGAAMFADPTWQLLQVFAQASLFALTGRELRVQQWSLPAPEAWRVELGWG